ncbi:hypothetical protein CLOSTMETH_02557, partial [[Clostridium] methylpentosum DSM 5476]
MPMGKEKKIRIPLWIYPSLAVFSSIKPSLPHRVKLVYIYLYDRMDREEKAWPGIKTIAVNLSLGYSK